VQYEGDPLVGRQPLQHHHGREPRVLTRHNGLERIVAVEAGHHRFW
jgi:hypothetical protein